MLDSKATLGVTGNQASVGPQLSTADLPEMTMPLRRFFPANESVRAHSAALGSQGDMYDGSEFWWRGTVKEDQPPVGGAVSSNNGGVIASNCMHLAAYKHVNEIWLHRGRAGVPWYANDATYCRVRRLLALTRIASGTP